MQESDVPGADSLSGLTASFTDLDTDLLGVKLDDCSRYFKKEIMVSKAACSAAVIRALFLVNQFWRFALAGILSGFQNKIDIRGSSFG